MAVLCGSVVDRPDRQVRTALKARAGTAARAMATRPTPRIENKIKGRKNARTWGDVVWPIDPSPTARTTRS